METIYDMTDDRDVWRTERPDADYNNDGRIVVHPDFVAAYVAAHNIPAEPPF